MGMKHQLVVQKDQLKPQDGKAEGAGSKAQQQSDDPKPAAAREQLQETTHNTGKAAHPLFAGGASGRTQSLKALSITEFEELEARWGHQLLELRTVHFLTGCT
jgi:hypothetical protein